MLHLKAHQDVAFPIDREQSFIEGTILAHAPGTLYWSIEIECQPTLVPFSEEDKIGLDEEGSIEECHLEISALTKPLKTWRDLAGQTFQVAYDDKDVHPILPDNPGNLYYGSTHHCPNANQIRFPRREGCWFELEWSCIAKAHPKARGIQIEVKTKLPLKEFSVYFQDPKDASTAAARNLALQFAILGDLGVPKLTSPQWVRVPIGPVAS